MTVLPSVPSRALIHWDIERWEISSFTCLLCDFSAPDRLEFISHLQKHAVYAATQSLGSQKLLQNGTSVKPEPQNSSQHSDESDGSIHIRVDSDTSRHSESLNSSFAHAQPPRSRDASRAEPRPARSSTPQREPRDPRDVTPVKQEQELFAAPPGGQQQASILDLSLEQRMRADSPRALLQPIALSPMMLRAQQESAGLLIPPDTSAAAYSALYGPWSSVYNDVFGYHGNMHGYLSSADQQTVTSASYVTPEKASRSSASGSASTRVTAAAGGPRPAVTSPAPSPAGSDCRSETRDVKSPYLGEVKVAGSAGDLQQHTCVHCSQTFDSFDTLCTHMETHGGSIYRCTRCTCQPQAIFTTREALETHVATMHPGAVTKATVEQPATSGKSAQDQATDSPKAVCTLCGDRTHGACFHEGKKFVCPICGCIYANKQGLRNHIQGFHEGRKKYVCSVCQTGFMQKSQFIRHVTRVHPAGADTEPDGGAAGKRKSNGGGKGSESDGKKRRYFQDADLGVRSLEDDGDPAPPEEGVTSPAETPASPPGPVTSSAAGPSVDTVTSSAYSVTSSAASMTSSPACVTSSAACVTSPVLNVPVVRPGPQSAGSVTSQRSVTSPGAQLQVTPGSPAGSAPPASPRTAAAPGQP